MDKPTVRGNARKRALEACNFCRQRKSCQIKCNSARPCSNCQTNKRHCVYNARHSRGSSTVQTTITGHQDRDHEQIHGNPDESNNVISHPVHIDDSDIVSHSNQNTNTVAEQHTTPTDRSISRILVADDGRSSYHGQTSALFELQESSAKATSKRLPSEWVQKALLAEAAIQRQMESINHTAGKLDFDDVDPDLGMHLLSLHWNRQHHSFLITYRPAFMRDMACNGPYFSKLLLNAIYFGASKFSPRLEVRKDPDDVRTAGWKYRERVRDLLGRCLDKSEITTIQALLVMANSLFALGSERSAAWIYSGLAFRMITDLGMHSETSTSNGVLGLTDEDVEIRRRVFWGAFVVDKIQSLYHGRLPSIQKDDAGVPIEFLDLYEENEQWKPFAYTRDTPDEYNGTPAYSVSTFTALCRLSIIMNTILNQLYAERIMDCSPVDLSKILNDLHTSLEIWWQELPTHLHFGTQGAGSSIPPPHVLSLNATYNVLLILLHRHFVSGGHLWHNDRSKAVNSLLICVTVATRIVNLLKAYHQAFSIQRAPYLISYATYVSATIHVRIAAQKNLGSEAHKSLATCLAVFQLNQGTNSATARANAIIEGLMKKLNVSMSGVDHNLEDRRSFDGRAYQNTANTYHAEASAYRQGTPIGFSPSLDVDAVIQSFAPPRGTREDTREHQGRSVTENNGSSLEHGGLDNRQTNLGNAEGSWNIPHNHNDAQLYSQDHLTNSEPWMQNWQFSAYSTADVLFGFDGSAIDGFYNTDPF